MNFFYLIAAVPVQWKFLLNFPFEFAFSMHMRNLLLVQKVFWQLRGAYFLSSVWS